MQDSRYSDSVLGGRFTILGRKLRPFSYWHLFQLEASDSPFIDGKGVDETRVLAGAINIATCICRTRYPRQARSYPKWLRWLSAIRLRDVEQQAIEFGRYISFHTQGPEFWISERATATRGQMPQSLSGVSGLMLLGLSEKEAWNCPVGKGEWLKAARGVHSGDDLDFVQPESEEGMAKLNLLRDGMAALCEALKSGGEAIAPATQLREANLLADDCFKLVQAWQKARAKERKVLLKELSFELPNLTLDD